MMRFLLLFVLLFPSLVYAQPAGYAGRKLIIKTDVLNGKYLGGRNVEIEYAMLRKFSLGFTFRYHSALHKQKFNRNDEGYLLSLNPGNYDMFNGVQPDRARIEAITYKIQVRYYPRVIFSAPKGFFLYGAFEFGKATVTHAATISYPGAIMSYGNIHNVNVKQYELGLGVQEIFWSFFVVEWSGAINMSRFNGGGSLAAQRYTTGVARYYGPNLLPFGKSQGTNPFPVFQDDDSKPYVGSFGFSFYLKMGFLLF